MKVYGIETRELTAREKAGASRAYILLSEKQGEVASRTGRDEVAWWTAYCKLRNAATYLNELLAAADRGARLEKCEDVPAPEVAR